MNGTLRSISKLDAAIKAVATVHGVRVGDPNDRTTWIPDYKPEATQAEKDAAQAVIDAFDIAAADDKVDAAMEMAARTDADVRLVEDLWDLMKTHLSLTDDDLPAAAKQRMVDRRAIRDRL